MTKVFIGVYHIEKFLQNMLEGGNIMDYIKDIDKDEIRDGFLVTSNRKKIWNKELETWKELDRICTKNNIKYYPTSGTLLGLSQYSGFIPWDDDMDFCLLRPDFNKLSSILENELGDNFVVDYMRPFFIKISNKNTTLIWIDENTQEKKFSHVGIDIVPLDIFPSVDETEALNSAKKLLYLKKILRNNKRYIKDLESFKEKDKYLSMKDKSPKDFYKFIKNYAEDIFNQSIYVKEIARACLTMIFNKPYLKSYFSDIIYKDFELVKIPVPRNYNEIISNTYGKFKRFPNYYVSHVGYIVSPDIECEYMKNNIDLSLY